MGLFSKKSTTRPEPAEDLTYPPGEERYPGSAGYSNIGLKKNAMPDQRFKFVRPDGKADD